MTAPIEQFANRLRRMHRHFGRWARRTGLSCYRIYDRDVPGWRLAIDLYDGRAHVQRFAPRSEPADGDGGRERERILAVVGEVLGLRAPNLFYKVRRRQRRGRQIQRLASERAEFLVREGGLVFRVNLSDYLDTGLFLDHRPTRAWVQKMATGRRVLNLYCYTGAFTVYAAAGGAAATTSVDLSRTYLRWAADNLRHNGITPGERHRLVRADALAWLERAAASGERPYDLIVVDPPTHSRSSRLERDFAVQRDHVRLLRAALALLAPGGTLLFSTNYRRFALAQQELGPGLLVRDVTARTTPPDFQRRPPHRAWTIRRRSGPE
ncbi:MAG: hypothetical protein KatS3mg102_0075 [Planctomycetota bacterium]|nr:MAG: hypothetical protein KatS3mg102_0075 [Planctomycetota bacterium]